MTGSCEAGLTVTLGGSVTGGHTTSCAAGNFSFASWILSTGNGSKSVTVSQTDAAMNVGTSSARSFTFPQPPTAPTLTAANVAGLKPA
ncbi:MAG: hypothetical protein EBR09_16565, partial [Proteobacteria bacterium]|nr:hypothetical protein [Pseudomonadota bacterium]